MVGLWPIDKPKLPHSELGFLGICPFLKRAKMTIPTIIIQIHKIDNLVIIGKSI